MKFFILIIILIIIGCNNNPKNSQEIKKVQKNDTTVAARNFVDLDSIDAKHQQLLDTNYHFLNKLLDSSLNLTYRHGIETPFTASLDTSVFKFKNMHATISFGRLFSSDRQHLIIKRFINEDNDYETSLYTDIFLLDKNKFRKVAADTSGNGYGEDYFEDVNHDGYKDYVVQSYSGSGCCPRNLEMAFLYKQNDGTFKVVDLFNREVDSSTNFFYETSYGLGDYITLYKYKWLGLRKELLEEISVTHTPEGKTPSSYTKIIYPAQKEIRIKKLPDDFKRLKMAEYITKIESK